MNYLTVNKELWNKRTPVHIQSQFYDNAAFLAGKNSLHDIELGLLGDVQNKEILHLQCHFGQDSISLARMGAKVTGVDFSENAINEAHVLNQKAGTSCHFICSDVYSLSEKLNHQFDIVFTSYGVIGWLPDLSKWARLIHQFLKPGGRFIMAEFHPLIWMYDNDLEKIKYSYFNIEEIVESEKGTYADTDSALETTSVTFNHSLSEVIQNLLLCNLKLSHFSEYDYSPYHCFSNMIEVKANHFMIKGMEGKWPLVYVIEAIKPVTV
jgi:2-polyprenyl-3-methyl-5-hydroxy-6-metoxy-1,4-benzoquinol methylase